MGAGLTPAQLRAALKRAGRTRGIDAEADRLRTVLRGASRKLSRTPWGINFSH